MKTSHRLSVLLTSACLIGPQPAAAQVIVYDPTAVAHLLNQAQTALSQLENLRQQLGQARALYDSLNGSSAVNAIASELLPPELQQTIGDFAELRRANLDELSALGALGERAGVLLDESRRAVLQDPSGLMGFAHAETRAVTNLAIAEDVGARAASRAEGLVELRKALDSAPSARAALDLGARLSAETALMQNEALRLQGLSLLQTAEDRLAEQQDHQRARANRQERATRFQQGFAP